MNRTAIMQLAKGQQIIKRTGEALLDVIYPPRCPVCDRVLGSADRGRRICGHCLDGLPRIRQPFCFQCGRPLPETEARAERCAVCLREPPRYVQGRSVLRYEKQMRESILRMKFHNRREYLDFYAFALAEGAKAFLADKKDGVLVPVPMHPEKVRERGFDHCRLLAGKLSLLCGIDLAQQNLVRVRYTRPQKGLGKEERKRNLAGAFVLQSEEGLHGPVVLLDDIYTTGATMNAAALALTGAGYREVYALTLCMAIQS